MSAGRELDALVAEKVMGLPVVWATPPYTNMPGFREDARYPWLKGEVDGVSYDWARVDAYSTSIAAAWQVVEHFKKQEAYFKMSSGFGSDWVEVRFAVPLADNDPRQEDGFGNWAYDAEAPTAPHAICLAALKAAGVEL